ncbi:hypothetical protein AcV5_001618 [Taiwanofungus camphoratus]|nr:hypothetical protein AcV5_001618 [Antrodia cinnamomea]
MVHRPADSRLLTNLLSHEKDYSKHLVHLFDHSQTSLASFSAYASASPPQISQVIIEVAGVLSGADDALRKYVASLEWWQEQLKMLKDLEDEVGNVMRDREILVTRLIKASKSQKPSRDSLIALGGSGSSSSLSFSPSKPETSLPSLGPKLSAAQQELKACEAHLAEKERELEALRVSAIRQGLAARFRAMVECGWTWGEMGKEGLRSLDAMDANGHAPSQSASQINVMLSPPPTESTHPDTSASRPFSLRSPSPTSVQAQTSPRPYTLSIPPAHAISDVAVPRGWANATPAPWRISEVDEAEDGSSAEEEEDARPLEVHENARFAKGKSRAPSVSEPGHAPSSTRGHPDGADEARHVHFPPPSVESDTPSSQKGRKRTGSVSLFGRSIAALFHKDKDRDKVRNGSPVRPSPGGRWHTRTDRHLAQAKRGDDSSDDEYAASSSQYPTWSPAYTQSRSEAAVVPSTSDPGVNRGRLKRRTKRSSTQAKSGDESTRGWASDGASAKSAGTRGKGIPKGVALTDTGAKTRTQSGPPRMNGDARPDGFETPNAKGTSVQSEKGHATPEAKPTLSRNTSLSNQSVASAATAPARSDTPHPSSARQTALAHRRTPSLDLHDYPANASTSTSPAAHTNAHKRAITVPPPSRNPSGLTRTNDVPSLMSIVEGVARQNRAARAIQDPNRMLVVPRAPPPVSVRLEFGKTQHSERPPAPVQERRGSPLKSLAASGSASAPSVPVSLPTESATSPKPPAKMPLRSALRHSRTPSPNPPPQTAPSLSAALDTTVPAKNADTSKAVVTPVSTAQDAKQDDDTASIASYHTGHEVFDEEDSQPSPPPPPPHDVPPKTAGGSELSHSSSTTTTATAPVRRKSVRMSLPPTFSTTPPALDDEEEAQKGRHQPWSSSRPARVDPSLTVGWASRIEHNGVRDVWQDSSDEDEDYSTAKRLLWRVERKSAF